jgi:hypothetical protein
MAGGIGRLGHPMIGPTAERDRGRAHHRFGGPFDHPAIVPDRRDPALLRHPAGAAILTDGTEGPIGRRRRSAAFV